MLYIIGSLSNPQVIQVTKRLKAEGIPAFSEWMASGPEADQHWKNYGKEMGWSYLETLKSDFVQTAFNFDFKHMQQADGCILVMPTGKSAHCEFGWFVGSGRKAFILFDGEPDRPDLMPPNLATGVFFDLDSLIAALKPIKWYDASAVDPEILKQTITGQWQAFIPTKTDHPICCGETGRKHKNEPCNHYWTRRRDGRRCVYCNAVDCGPTYDLMRDENGVMKDESK